MYTVRYARQQSLRIIMIDPETLEVRYFGFPGETERQQFQVIDGKKKNRTEPVGTIKKGTLSTNNHYLL